MAKKFDDSDGQWVTINGQHIFIKEGQSPMDAFIKQKGLKNKKADPDEQKAVMEQEENKNTRDIESFNRMKKNLEELKTNPKTYMDRVFGDEDLTKEEYDRRVESSIKNYEKSIKQWEEEVMPSVKNNERYVKMYQEYLKEHPNTEKTLVEFAKEMRNKLKK